MFATDFQTAISNHLSLALRIVKLLIRLLYRLTIKFQTRTIVNNACILKERRNRSLFYILSFFFSLCHRLKIKEIQVGSNTQQADKWFNTLLFIPHVNGQ